VLAEGGWAARGGLGRSWAETLLAAIVVAWQIEQAMKSRKLSKNKMAALMETICAQFDRLLNPRHGDVTIDTLQRAATDASLKNADEMLAKAELATAMNTREHPLGSIQPRAYDGQGEMGPQATRRVAPREPDDWPIAAGPGKLSWSGTLETGPPCCSPL
jgi:hypothetical protein